MNARGLSPEVSALLCEAREAILLAGVHPTVIMLYGSEARGEATPESDIDLLVILEEDTPQAEASIRDAVYDVMWRHDFSRLISINTFAREEFEEQRRKGYSFVQNVDREGIVLWPAA